MAQHGGGGVVNDPHEFLGVLQFIPPSPLGHGVNAGHHVVQFGQHVVGVVQFAALQNVGLHAVEETEIRAFLRPCSVVGLDGTTLFKQVVRTCTVGNFERGRVVGNPEPVPSHFSGRVRHDLQTRLTVRERGVVVEGTLDVAGFDEVR